MVRDFYKRETVFRMSDCFESFCRRELLLEGGVSRLRRFAVYWPNFEEQNVALYIYEPYTYYEKLSDLSGVEAQLKIQLRTENLDQASPTFQQQFVDNSGVITVTCQMWEYSAQTALKMSANVACTKIIRAIHHEETARFNCTYHVQIIYI